MSNLDHNDDPVALTDIYRADANIAIWTRCLHPDLTQAAQNICYHLKHYQTRISGDLAAIQNHLLADLSKINGAVRLVEDVVMLADMFCELLGAQTVGLRLAVLSKAMCPKFHVDRVPARLITTYWGAGTEWVENYHVTRDEVRGIELVNSAPIKNLSCGEVALLKGEIWEGNEGRGLVHRSPSATPEAPRLVLTLDCM